MLLSGIGRGVGWRDGYVALDRLLLRAVRN